MPIDTLVAFFLASTMLALAPGPDNIFVLTHSAIYGRRAGFAVLFGLCTGLVAHSLAVALGVAVIFETSRLAYLGLKVFGAAYLIYIAWQVFKAPVIRIQDPNEQGYTAGRLYRRGIIMNITNPKVSLFFIAFLPQFTDPSRGPVWGQILVLGSLFIVSTFMVFGGVVVIAGKVGSWISKSVRAQRILNYSAAAILVVLSLSILG